MTFECNDINNFSNRTRIFAKNPFEIDTMPLAYLGRLTSRMLQLTAKTASPLAFLPGYYDAQKTDNDVPDETFRYLCEYPMDHNSTLTSDILSNFLSTREDPPFLDVQVCVSDIKHRTNESLLHRKTFRIRGNAYRSAHAHACSLERRCTSGNELSRRLPPPSRPCRQIRETSETFDICREPRDDTREA